jgi:hypothetical protein
MHVIAIVVATAALAACAARGLVEEPETIARLGFLNGPDIRRADVEARLGAPAAIYEDGKVVSYSLYMSRDGLSVTGSPLGTEQYSLVLEYGTDGRVVRRALTRRK